MGPVTQTRRCVSRGFARPRYVIARAFASVRETGRKRKQLLNLALERAGCFLVDFGMRERPWHAVPHGIRYQPEIQSALIAFLLGADVK